jgi:methionyl-tRNA formyltransferase
VRDPATARWIESERIDLLLNVHSLHVATPEVVQGPRVGSFNLHPGPLPDYAGLNAPSWAIYDGRISHAVTLHWMTPEVDAGPIAYSAELPIEPGDTGASLTANCVRHGLPLVGRLPDLPDVYFAVGFTGHGLGFGLATAERLAAHMLLAQDLEWLDARRLE